MATDDGARISRFGEYEGYSPRLFDEWAVSSQYVATRDGTKLALDIARPARDGVAVEEPFPVIWTYTRYHRRGRGVPAIERNPILQRLVLHGYVVIVANVRGGGASFGRFVGLWSVPETNDAYDLIDWMSKQSWSDGNVGMYGLSYMGITQYMAASTQHPALKAIMPENSLFDFYDAMYAGGIHRSELVKDWSDGVRLLDVETPPTPVDEDTDGALAAAAVREHRDNFDPTEELGRSPYRDSSSESFDWYRDTPSMVTDEINEAAIPIYHCGAWYDAYTLDTLLLYANLRGPAKLTMGPWAHEPSTPREREERVKVLSAEIHRWYDYWLKGVQNGVMDDPPIHIAVVDTPHEDWTWVALDRLPTTQESAHGYYFDRTSRPDNAAPFEYVLTTEKPAQHSSVDYTVDPDTTTGTSTRWDANFGGTMDYGDRSANDLASLTFTTAPLEHDAVVVGAPVVTLFASSTATDTDFYALLEEVDADGSSTYVSEGMLRGSFRRLATPPWEALGLPWHRGHEEDVTPLTPGEVYNLQFAIYPTAYRFNQGNRIRIAIMGADKDNTEPPPAPGAVMTIHTGGENASYVSLLVQPADFPATAD